MITPKNPERPKVFLIDENLKVPSSMPESLSEVYHENTKMHFSDVRPWLVPVIPAGLSGMTVKTFFQRSAQSYKSYDGYPSVPLGGMHVDGTQESLWNIISRRRSQRNYTSKPVQKNSLAQILSYSYGHTGNLDGADNHVRLRAVPSAGALYPLDIYPLVNNVADMDNGLYHYNVRDHRLECLRTGDFLPEIYPLIQPSNNEWLTRAGVIFFITATFKRNQLKYGERGYRGVLLDAGHLSQNVQLTATALGYGACVIVACLDDPINDFLDVDGVDESVLLAVSIGVPVLENTDDA